MIIRRSLLDLDAYIADLAARHPEFTAMVGRMMEDSMKAEWGERCPDFDDECPACKAWKDFDARMNS